MQNVTTSIKAGKLVITCDLDAEGTPSASGKTSVIASTRGNVPIAHNSRLFNLGVNLFEKPTQ